MRSGLTIERTGFVWDSFCPVAFVLLTRKKGVPALVHLFINPASYRRLVIPFAGATLAIPGRSSSRSIAPSCRTEQHVYTTCPQNAERHASDNTGGAHRKRDDTLHNGSGVRWNG